MSLNDRIEALARDVARREAAHARATAAARAKASSLHGRVDAARATPTRTQPARKLLDRAAERNDFGACRCKGSHGR